MPLADAYANRRVFVTGHTGFKGSWLASWLGRLGADVTGYALEPPTDPNLFDALGLADRMDHVIGDVRDADGLSRVVRDARPSIVFHLAARALVLRAYDEPRDTYETNVMGTVNLLEAVRACPSVEGVVVVTSDKVYENPETGVPFTETDRLGGLEPYGSSKAGAELVAAAYRASYFRDGVALATVRAGNVIGGGDWAPDRIVPDCVRALEAGRPIEVRNRAAVRPWQHVLEPLSGYLEVGACLASDGATFAEAWNFGPEADEGERPVEWLVEQFLAEWGSGSWEPSSGVGVQAPEALRLSLDSSKARDRLGWRPVWSPNVAVQRTAAWYRDFRDAPERARELVDADLTTYGSDARSAGLAWAGDEVGVRP